jgi:Uma2 family endonuclease
MLRILPAAALAPDIAIALPIVTYSLWTGSSPGHCTRRLQQPSAIPRLRVMSTVLQQPWTVERFLAWEDRQEGRHEFDGTRIIAMTGGSRDHQRIVHNLLRLLEDRLDPEQFDAVAEMRLDVGGKVRYPDVLVSRGRIPGPARTLRDAVVAFEVLSADTATTDRETKRAEYAGVPGMRRYVLIEQLRRAATVLERSGDGWLETPVLAGLIPLPELGIDVPLADVYRGVRLA